MKLLLTALASFAVTFSPSTTERPSGAPRYALQANVEVSGTTIFLSDLVQGDAPDYVREEAARIPLGLAPQTGTTRVLLSSAIAATVERAGLPSDLFAVPDKVIVVRAGRKLSEQEVWTAIERYLKVHPASAIRDVRPDQLTFDARWSIPSEARVDVEKVTSDKSTRTLQIQLKVAGADGALPICVRVGKAQPFDSETAALAVKPAFISTDKKLSTQRSILVDPKTVARLHLHSADSDMVLDVRPLERGALDETIRVRLTSSAKTLQARVVGTNALDATF